MDRLGLKKPIAPDMSRLPAGSWFLQFSYPCQTLDKQG